MVWCVGDGFTTGAGINGQYSWTSLLADCLDYKIAVVGCENADNDWIEDQVNSIFDKENTARVIVQWSYFNAYPESCLSDFTGHISNMHQRIQRIESKKANNAVTHCFVPDAVFPGPDRKLFRDWISSLPTTVDIIGPLNSQDLASDGWHAGEMSHQAMTTILQRKFTASPLINNNWM